MLITSSPNLPVYKVRPSQQEMFFLLSFLKGSVMGSSELVLEVFLVSGACRSRPMIVDLTTSPKISLPRTYIAHVAPM